MNNQYNLHFLNTILIKQISQELIEMAKKDQRARLNYLDKKDSLSEKLLDSVDLNNRTRFKEIFQKVGVITEKFGFKAQSSALLIVQHMPKSEVSFMKKYLKLMKTDLNKRNVDQYVMLVDRVRNWEGKDQLFGTQFIPVASSNVYKLLPLYKPENVNKRRLALGLNSIEEYHNSIMKKNNIKILS